MKKLIIAVIFAVFMVAGLPVFAQEEQKEEKNEPADYYYKNITLEKIYLYRRGYVIQYRRGLNQIGRAYLPLEWFSSTASKGEIINLPAGNSWPSMSIYYNEGEFSHVRLYVHRSSAHRTWGTIPQNVNLDSRFDDVEDLKIKF